MRRNRLNEIAERQRVHLARDLIAAAWIAALWIGLGVVLYWAFGPPLLF
jgi:hypothetical protein